MANIAAGTFKSWQTGDVISATEYAVEQEIIRQAINDNDARLGKTYDKTTVDSKLGAKANAGDSYTKQQSDMNYVSPLSYLYRDEKFTVAEGQTVFNLTQGSYYVGKNQLVIYADGIRGEIGIDYIETSTTQFTTTTQLPAGTALHAIYAELSPATGANGIASEVANSRVDTQNKTFDSLGARVNDLQSRYEGALLQPWKYSIPMDGLTLDSMVMPAVMVVDGTITIS